MVAIRILLPHPVRKEPREYTLDIVDGNKGNLETLDGVTFDYTAEVVLQTETSEVYKGTLTQEGYAYESKVACKIAEGNSIARLQREFELYTTVLKEVSDTVVPKYICYCTGQSPYTKKSIACLLTRYRGRPLPDTYWLHVEPEIRYKALMSLMQLHRLGVRHNDFVPCNVVIDDAGRVTVVDFNEATVGHECAVAHKEFYIYAPKPSKVDFACDEVYNTSVNMDIWTPVHCIFKGLSVVMTTVEEPEDLVKLLLQRWPNYNQRDAIREATEFYDRYVNRYVVRLEAAQEKTRERQRQAAGLLKSSSTPTPPTGH